MADIEFQDIEAVDSTRAPGAAAAGKLQGLVNWAGALTSVGLVLGLGLWGYQLSVRDVTGVPVVRALEGPMRVAPETPGGRPAEHQGLSVNAVAAEGEAAAPADRLVLAPEPQALSTEDAAGTLVAQAAKPVAAEPALSAEDQAVVDALELAEEVTAGLAPMALEPAAPIVAPKPVVVGVPPAAKPDPGVDAASETLPASVPGVKRSPRPAARPAEALLPRKKAPVTAPAEAPASSVEVSSKSIPPGTNLVQLGAYDSAEIARAEWQRLSGRFGSLMEGKQRLVMAAKSGGRTFYRLRAVGFTDISDARRFCAALTAERADCIPVVSR